MLSKNIKTFFPHLFLIIILSGDLSFCKTTLNNATTKMLKGFIHAKNVFCVLDIYINAI